MVSKVMVVWIGQNLKPVDKIIIPDVVTDNQPITHPLGGANIQKLYINKVGLVLESDQVCAKLMPSMIPMIL